MGVGGQRHAPAELPPGKKPGTHFYKFFVDRATLYNLVNKTNFVHNFSFLLTYLLTYAMLQSPS